MLWTRRTSGCVAEAAAWAHRPARTKDQSIRSPVGGAKPDRVLGLGGPCSRFRRTVFWVWVDRALGLDGPSSGSGGTVFWVRMDRALGPDEPCSGSGWTVL